MIRSVVSVLPIGISNSLGRDTENYSFLEKIKWGDVWTKKGTRMFNLVRFTRYIKDIRTEASVHFILFDQKEKRSRFFRHIVVKG